MIPPELFVSFTTDFTVGVGTRPKLTTRIPLDRRIPVTKFSRKMPEGLESRPMMTDFGFSVSMKELMKLREFSRNNPSGILPLIPDTEIIRLGFEFS